jgi:hypothetical protein
MKLALKPHRTYAYTYCYMKRPQLEPSFLETQTVFIAPLHLIPLPWYSAAPHFIICSPASNSLGSNNQVSAHWEKLDSKAGDFLLEPSRYQHASWQWTTATWYHSGSQCHTVLCLPAEQCRLYKEQSNIFYNIVFKHPVAPILIMSHIFPSLM